MKNKKNKSSSLILQNSKNYFAISKDFSFKEENKESLNKPSPHYYNRKQKSRQINSLDELTKKFLKCVLDAESNTINLNTVMKKIKLKKRRIYDITNVLEGKCNYFYY
jgi:hypothetical protein